MGRRAREDSSPFGAADTAVSAADDALPPRPRPVRVRRPEDPLTPGEIDLRERLQAQPHPNAETRG